MKFPLLVLILLTTTTVQAGDYNRKDWPHWSDLNSDCQNTRAEILIRDSRQPVTFKKGKRCKVVSGVWVCPYTGRTYNKASDIDIDHIVSLEHAHENGAENWTRAQREAFANDPLNLLATEDNENQSKGHRGPAKWKPEATEYWPEFAARWIAVKDKYGLFITPEEEGELQAMMGNERRHVEPRPVSLGKERTRARRDIDSVFEALRVLVKQF